MSSVVLVGAQWGDEGKGKITDYLASRADMVVRYQGGNNAGHTVKVGDINLQLHMVPSGIMYSDKPCVIGNGVVLDPEVLFEELDNLKQYGIKGENLVISDSAHLIMPYHKLLDYYEEESRGDRKIGTTKRGVGPAYVDKAARRGIRVGDLYKPETLREKLEAALRINQHILTGLYGASSVDVAEIEQSYLEFAGRMEKYVADSSLLIYEAISSGKNVLFEGAQGTLLDIDHGTYPFVTSSQPVSGGATTGAGIGPTAIDTVLGVTKAYCTRVGEGPFPTELHDETGDLIRETGQEFGTTTGRPRRCGWLDIVILKYAVRVNGLSKIALTKLDVLSSLPTIKICTGYRVNGQMLKEYPHDLDTFARCEPVYEEVPGWQKDIGNVRTFEDLPQEARDYVRRIEDLSGVETAMVAVGPKRNQTIVLSEIF